MGEQLSLFGPPEKISCGDVKSKKELDTLPESPGRPRKWPKNLGMTYVGSKSRLLRGFWHLLPAADVFVDIFAGGCSITHAAMLDSRWNRVLSNDLLRTPEAFLFAINGGARKLAERWISRWDFKLLLARSDPAATLLRLAYSFSCDGTTYRYGKKTERWKKKLHEAIFADDPSRRLQPLRDAVAAGCADKSLLVLQSFDCFKRYVSLEALRGLDSKVQTSAMEYQEVPLPENAIIYADPPYKDRHKYHCIGEFDSASFWEWARACGRPVFISEYEAPPDFECIWSTRYRPRQCANGRAAIVEECLFANASAVEALHRAK